MLLRGVLVVPLLAASAVAANSSAPSNSPETEWDRTIQSAMRVMEMGEYLAAAHMIEHALELVEADDKDSLRVAITLNLLGPAYLEMGRWREAEVCDRRAILIWESHPEAGETSLCRALENLAALHTRMRRYARAEALYARSLAIREQSGSDFASVAIVLNNLGEVYRRQGRVADAERMFRRSLLRSEGILGPEHPEVAVCLNNLATLYGDEGQLSEARATAERAVAIWEKNFGSQHPIFAQGLTNLATLYTETGQPEKAEAFYRRALEITQRIYGPEHRKVGWVLSNYAVLLKQTGRKGEAKRMVRRAREISRRHARDNYMNHTVDLSELRRHSSE